MLPIPQPDSGAFCVSTKTRVFSVSALQPVARPYSIIAHSRHQLARRLAEALRVELPALDGITDALWKGLPVVLTDSSMMILPGRFGAVSYQVLDPNAALF